MALSACSASDGDPAVANPQPVPVPNPDLIYLGGGSGGGGGESFVAGAPSAADPAVEVVIENVARDERFTASAGQDGSFLAKVRWVDGETLRCWARRQDQQSAKVGLLLPPSEPSPPPPSIPLTVDSVSPVSGGQTTVAGAVDIAATVIVANQQTGAVATTTLEQPGQYSIKIAASSGDRLVVFAVTDSRDRLGTEEVNVP